MMEILFSLLRRRWRVLLVLTMLILVLPFVRVRLLPYPAIVSSPPVAWAASSESTWETGVIEAEVSMAGISWTLEPPQEAWVRGRGGDGRWTEWFPIGLSPDHGPDPGTLEAERSARNVSDGVWFEDAEAVQYRIVAQDASAVGAELVETSGRGRPLADKLGLLWDRLELSLGPDAADAAPGRPPIVSRDVWGGDACIASKQIPPAYVDQPDVVFVHHTVTGNSYAASSSASIVFNICTYHVNSRDFDDIGYNFLIDRYGVIFEGRGGGIEEPVRGAHTGGFNSYSIGVAFIGTHTSSAPTAAARASFEQLAAWKMNLHGLEAHATAVVESLGSDIWPEGQMVTFNRVEGHRAAKATSCPGDACYSLLGAFRTGINNIGGAKIYANFSAFDHIAGAPGAYDLASLPLRFTAPTTWTATITDYYGRPVFSSSRYGLQGVLYWDGRDSVGTSLPIGQYHLTISGVADGTANPTAIERLIQLGTYEWPFVDDEGSVHEEDIHSLWLRRITRGCDELSSYCPDRTLTRAEFAVMLTRAMGGEDELPAHQGYFPDVTADLWYSQHIEWLYEQGIATHVGTGDFLPEAPTNRATASVMIIKAIGEVGNLPLNYNAYFTDVPWGQWYTRYVERMYQLEIGLGYGDGTFRPLSLVSRAEIASLIIRAFT